MNRAERRQLQRVIDKAQKNFDASVPLVFEGGYEHVCGGDAEKANAWTAYCAKCQRMVPAEEVRRKRE